MEDADSATSSATDNYVVLVSLSNPDTAEDLVALAAAIADNHDGRVVAVTIIQVPDQTSLEAARDHFDYTDSTAVLDKAEHVATDFGVSIETKTVFSHRLFQAVFSAARRSDAELCVMGWGPDSPGVAGRTEPVVDELAQSLPCDLLVLKDREYDPSRILLPTTGGPHTALAADVARILRDVFGSTITLLHVTDDQEAGRAFLSDWASGHDLASAECRIVTGDVETAIAAASVDHTLILIGATQIGVLSRLVRGSLVLSVLEDVECSVLIAECETERSVFDRLFGRRRR